MKDKNGAYLFVCFQDTEKQSNVEELFYGVSVDGYNFKSLNSNKPVFKSYLGTGHMRDPFVFKGIDGYYYIVATDMDCRKGWESQSTIVIYKSKDLINFEDGVLIDYSKFDGFSDCNRAWAPQIIWCENHINSDNTKGAYMIYLAIQTKSTAHKIGTVMYRNFATDLMDKSSYTTPEFLILGEENGKYKLDGAIDGDIIYDPVNKRYLMYFDGRRIAESVTENAEGPYKEIDGFVFDVDRLEGSNIYKLYDENKWIICADGNAFGTGFNFAYTTDFKTYTRLKENIDFSLDFKPRHGYVIHITNDELRALTDKFGY